MSEKKSDQSIIKPLENNAVFLCGDLDDLAVESLWNKFGIQSWLYLNPERNEWNPRAKVRSFEQKEGREEKTHFKVIPIDGTNLNEHLKNDLLEYMRTEFKTPAVIQCSTATRAGIPYVLYLAEKFSLSFETAMRVARDMELNVTTRENFVQFLKRSIEKKSLSDSEVIFRQLFEKESSTYTYLLGCAETRECLLIDPVLETVERDLRVVDELGLKLKLCVNTHCHADHITGSGEIKKMRKEVKSVISKRAGAMADVLIDEGDVVQVGTSVKLKCLATPGHTDGCVSFVLGDNTDVFTGDALLIRGCGRTDFQGGSSETLFDGVTGKLFGGLPDTCKVWPAHDYKGRMVSTIGEEKRLNPRLGAGKTKEEFVQIMKDLNLPYPKKIDASLPRNLKCGAEE